MKSFNTTIYTSTYIPLKKKLITVGNNTIRSFEISNNLLSNPEIIVRKLPNIFSIDVSSDGDNIAMKNTSGSIFIYSLKEKKFLWKRKENETALNNVYFLPDGKNLLSADEHGTLFLLDVQSEKLQSIKRINGTGFGKIVRVSGAVFLWIEKLTCEESPLETNLYLVYADGDSIKIEFWDKSFSMDVPLMINVEQNKKLFYSNGFDIWCYDIFNRTANCILSEQQYKNCILDKMKKKNDQIDPAVLSMIQGIMQDFDLGDAQVDVTPFENFAIIDSDHLVLLFSDSIVVFSKNKNEIIFSFEKSDAFFNSVAKIESEDIYLFGGWEHSVSFSKKELITR
ncbi:MAG: hypothetical protein SOR38_03395 [Oscillospiraceae bacterium]|nr:hypothetical protein [Oscillospiraceae bacterium]